MSRFLDSLFRKRRLDANAAAIYHALVSQARSPGFYRDLRVSDTPEGRFEMIALHAFLVLNRLAGSAPGNAASKGDLGQAVLDMMFADMDRNLREMGTGDLGVARRVKALAEGFNGRSAAYHRGLAGSGSLVDALERNVYGGDAPDDAASALAAYMRESVVQLRDLSAEQFQAGALAFAPVPRASVQPAEEEAKP